jgi:hypothetical protein
MKRLILVLLLICCGCFYEPVKNENLKRGINYCNKCGEHGLKAYCGKCGTKFVNDYWIERICSECGNDILWSNDSFCGDCGSGEIRYKQNKRRREYATVNLSTGTER